MIGLSSVAKHEIAEMRNFYQLPWEIHENSFLCQFQFRVLNFIGNEK